MQQRSEDGRVKLKNKERDGEGEEGLEMGRTIDERKEKKTIRKERSE